MAGRVQDKVAIITGAGSGIGEACMVLFAKEGAKVVGCSRTQSALDDTLEKVGAAGGEGRVVAADLSSEAGAQSVIDATLEAHGRVDILVHAASVGWLGIAAWMNVGGQPEPGVRVAYGGGVLEHNEIIRDGLERTLQASFGGELQLVALPSDAAATAAAQLARDWHRSEPGDCSQLERPSRFRSDLLRCLTEGTLSEGEIRSMYPDIAAKLPLLESESQWKWRGFRSMSEGEREDALQQAAEGAGLEYGKDGSLADLELVDDDE